MSAPTTPITTSTLPQPYGWRRLCFTCEGHLDLSWLLALGYFFLGAVASVREVWGPLEHRPRALWWAWLAGQSLIVLIAAVPIAKARLLASLRKQDCAIPGTPATAPEATS